MQRFVSRFLCIPLLVVLLPAHASALFFPKPDDADAQRAAVEQLASSRRETTRAAFVASLMADLFPTEISTDCFATLSLSRYDKLFSDVTTEASYAPALCVAMSKGIVRGYPDGAFRPDQTINMAETAKVLAKAYGLATEPTDPAIPWYQPSVNALRAMHIPFAASALARGLTPDEAQNVRWSVRCSQFTIWIEKRQRDCLREPDVEQLAP